MHRDFFYKNEPWIPFSDLIMNLSVLFMVVSIGYFGYSLSNDSGCRAARQLLLDSINESKNEYSSESAQVDSTSTNKLYRNLHQTENTSRCGIELHYTSASGLSDIEFKKGQHNFQTSDAREDRKSKNDNSTESEMDKLAKICTHIQTIYSRLWKLDKDRKWSITFVGHASQEFLNPILDADISQHYKSQLEKLKAENSENYDRNGKKEANLILSENRSQFVRSFCHTHFISNSEPKDAYKFKDTLSFYSEGQSDTRSTYFEDLYSLLPNEADKESEKKRAARTVTVRFEPKL